MFARKLRETVVIRRSERRESSADLLANVLLSFEVIYLCVTTLQV